MNSTSQNDSDQNVRTINLLLKISSLLMISGANTYRTLYIIDQFAEALGYSAQVFITHTKFIMTLTNMKTQKFVTSVKKIPPIGVNFTTISGLSKAGLHAHELSWSIDKIEKEVDRIEKLKHYPRIIVLLAVSLAGAGFCNIFGGDHLNMLVTFVATFFGLFTRQEMTKRNNYTYVVVFISAFIASLVASVGIYFNIGASPQVSLATSVLFLIPGVPLINSFSDLIDGYIINGLVRLTNGLLIVFSIALGLALAMYLFDISKV
ncbi:MAG: threonine/serine exporter ThrE family protein [Hyphomicrobiales bacterium]